MSYILDALKRAEAERERGSIPGLHARQMASYDDPDPQSTQRWLWILAPAVLILVVGAAGFWWWHTPARDTGAGASKTITKVTVPEPPVVTAAVPATQVPVNPAPTIEGDKAGVPSKPLSGPPPVAPVQVQVAPPVVATKTVAVTTPVVVPAAVAVSTTASPLPTANLAPQTVSSPQPTTPGNQANVAASAGSAVPLLSELPEAMRRQIPALVIAGAVYSDDPNQRLLLVNNQAFGQGNTVAPGVQLEEIQTSSSIFNFQGTRFQVMH